MGLNGSDKGRNVECMTLRRRLHRRTQHMQGVRLRSSSELSSLHKESCISVSSLGLQCTARQQQIAFSQNAFIFGTSLLTYSLFYNISFAFDGRSLRLAHGICSAATEYDPSRIVSDLPFHVSRVLSQTVIACAHLGAADNTYRDKHVPLPVNASGFTFS